MTAIFGPFLTPSLPLCIPITHDYQTSGALTLSPPHCIHSLSLPPKEERAEKTILGTVYIVRVQDFGLF